jgi:hypothetical protein
MIAVIARPSALLGQHRRRLARIHPTQQTCLDQTPDDRARDYLGPTDPAALRGPVKSTPLPLKRRPALGKGATLILAQFHRCYPLHPQDA